jgi:hypothetical protein
MRYQYLLPFYSGGCLIRKKLLFWGVGQLIGRKYELEHLVCHEREKEMSLMEIFSTQVKNSPVQVVF